MYSSFYLTILCWKITRNYQYFTEILILNMKISKLFTFPILIYSVQKWSRVHDPNRKYFKQHVPFITETRGKFVPFLLWKEKWLNENPLREIFQLFFKTEIDNADEFLKL